jgi:hypothetical protein
MLKSNCKKKSSKIKTNDFFTDITIETKYNDNISEKKFFIPSIDEYDMLLRYNYKIKQLQTICKHYKQKTTGKKIDLLNNIYNYLRLSYYTIKIQKYSRGYIQRIYNYYRGPAYIKRKVCSNETDFCTLENIQEISKEQFISFKNEDGFIYGYDVISLYNLFIKNGKYKTTNPYDRKKFPSFLYKNIKKIVKLCKVLNITMNLQLETDNAIDKKKSLEFEIISLFQKIDEMGFITNIEWFTSLNSSLLVKYIRELNDIWNYRAQISNRTKIEICPPHGNPFVNLTSYNNLLNYNSYQLKSVILKIMENLINNGQSTENKSLGAFYVLSALTLVNQDAADSLPWLYQSVMHN